MSFRNRGIMHRGFREHLSSKMTENNRPLKVHDKEDVYGFIQRMSRKSGSKPNNQVKKFQKEKFWFKDIISKMREMLSSKKVSDASDPSVVRIQDDFLEASERARKNYMERTKKIKFRRKESGLE